MSTRGSPGDRRVPSADRPPWSRPSVWVPLGGLWHVIGGAGFATVGRGRTRRVFGASALGGGLVLLVACGASTTPADTTAQADHSRVSAPQTSDEPADPDDAALNVDAAAALTAPEAAPAQDTAAVVGAATGQSALVALAQLKVKGRAPKTGYDRDLFAYRQVDLDHNGCDTRNDILGRDLTDLTVKDGTNGCVVLTGTLNDPYTGTMIAFTRGATTSSDVQIDHVVALSDAWQKGVQGWDATTQASFGNDPLNLLAVSGPANTQKGDGDAATWLPANKAYRCQYVARQIAVKYTYGLWVTAAERDAMAGVLSSCPNEPLPPGSTLPPAVAVPTPEPVVEQPVAPAPPPAEPAPATPVNVYYENCDAVRAAGAAPLLADQPGYTSKLDRDGVICSPRTLVGA